MDTVDVGQLLMVGFSGTKPSDDFLHFLNEEKIGAVLLLGDNLTSPNQMLKLTEQLQDSVSNPLLIAVDHEGGRVFRMPKPFTHFPSMFSVVKKAKEEGAEIVLNIGKTMATELRAVGINCNFAPVLDVSTNPFNKVIGDRSFGNDPKLVATLGCELIKGLEVGGVMSCGKHFPGHGDTNHDSHETLPTLSHTRKRFDLCEFVPFRAAIAAGVPSIMTGHIRIPLLDAENIVTTSRHVTTTILRRELQFEGIIFTDDLLMQGIASLMPIPTAAVRAVQAGADMLIVSKGFEMQKNTVAELRRAVEQKEIPEEQLLASFTRIQRAKKRYVTFMDRPALSAIGAHSHRELLAQVA